MFVAGSDKAVMLGVYVDGEEAPVFVAAPPLSDQAVQQIVETSARRIIRLCTKRGLLDDTAADPLADEEPVLAVLTAASVRGLIATGARSGQRLRRVLKDPATGVRTASLCFASRGFSLHAATRIVGRDRRGLERLCRYVARPALASGRLRLLASQRLCFALKTPWSDGTSHLLLSPMELLEKRAALVPPPRLHLLRYHGVLAPRARARDRIVPAQPVEASPPADGDTSAPSCGHRLRWATLLARVLGADLSQCAAAVRVRGLTSPPFAPGAVSRREECVLNGLIEYRIGPATGPQTTKPYCEPCQTTCKRSSASLPCPLGVFGALTRGPKRCLILPILTAKGFTNGLPLNSVIPNCKNTSTL